MRCPFCGHDETQVKDSRPAEDGAATRRRRSCPNCEERFTTFERIQIREMTVLKSDGRKQPFDRGKITRSMQVALQKRPVDLETIEKSVSDIVRQLEKKGEAEIEAAVIGGHVMETLKTLDPIGYIRYASVYKDFNDLDDFLKELKAVAEPAS
jgi:transcriptional repressor NrdR